MAAFNTSTSNVDRAQRMTKTQALELMQRFIDDESDSSDDLVSECSDNEEIDREYQPPAKLARPNGVVPMSVKIYLYYGPYEAAGTVEYRQFRLQGLNTILTEAGHSVELRPFRDWNVVELWVNGDKIFSCDIRHLDFGGDGKLDPLCLEACEAVKRNMQPID